MAKKAKFEIYEGLTWRKKKYLVFREKRIPTDELIEAGKKVFKCSFRHLKFTLGYIVDDDLYLTYPPLLGATQVPVVTYVR